MEAFAPLADGGGGCLAGRGDGDRRELWLVGYVGAIGGKVGVDSLDVRDYLLEGAGDLGGDCGLIAVARVAGLGGEVCELVELVDEVACGVGLCAGADEGFDELFLLFAAGAEETD